MLLKVLKFQNVGLLQNGTPNPVPLGKVALIYAENGRGKSTISSVLNACAFGDFAKVQAKKTIDSTGDVAISLLFSGSKTVAFSNGAWSQPVKNLLVFNAEFVEQNVYSGFEIRPEHREALLAAR